MDPRCRGDDGISGNDRQEPLTNRFCLDLP